MNDSKRKCIIYGILAIIWIVGAIIWFSTSFIFSHFIAGCAFLFIGIFYLILSFMFSKKEE